MKGHDMTDKIPAGLMERIEFNEEYRLDARDPEEFKDGYQLKWVGKDYARLQSGTAPTTMIAPDNKHNCELENAKSENIFLTGDNLEVLKHLLNAYRGEVDLIYIDPPYNTGSDGFAYNDRFQFSDDELRDVLGLSDDELQRLKSIQGKSNHSAWLTFMYPRLKVAQKLLRDSGIIFISIDDNEQANLKLLCDDAFGEQNLLAVLARRTKSGGGSAAHHFAVEHDYLLVYGRNKESAPSLSIPYTEDYVRRYSEQDELGCFFWDTMERSSTETTPYEIVAPDGQVLTGRWFRSEDRFKKDIETGEVRFLDRGSMGWSVQFKQRMAEGRKIRTLLADNEFKSSQADLDALNMGGVFPYPKTVYFLTHFMQSIKRENGLIVDFFAGSGTTAHAIMKLNADDGKNRRWILCNLDELVREDSEARRQGYNTIDEISRERIKRAAAKIKEDAGADLPEEFDGGFKHYRIANPDVVTLDKLTEFDKDQSEALFSNDMVTPFEVKEANATGEDVILTTWLLADGYPFSQDLRAVDFEGYYATYVDDSLLYLINSGWGTDQTKALLNMVGTNKLNLNTIILYGYSFDFESLRELEVNVRKSLGKDIQIEKRY